MTDLKSTVRTEPTIGGVAITNAGASAPYVPGIPIPSEADIIRRIGMLRYLEMRSTHVRELPKSRAYWGPDYDFDYSPSEEPE